MKKKRVVCLYRVSTKKQLDEKPELKKVQSKKEDPDEDQADIPMQCRECREFIKKHDDWELFDEVKEPGVSAYKVPIDKREKLTKIREMAKRKQFDVLLVFMFDRLNLDKYQLIKI